MNELFEDYGVVIIDGNDASLKQQLIPYIKNDLLQQTAHNEVNRTIAALQSVDKLYPVQVNPREINVFYLVEGLRERIVRTEEGFEVKLPIGWS